MLEEDKQALEVYEGRVLRTIFGSVQDNGVCRLRMNQEHAALFGEPSIRKMAKAGRMGWAGHVVRMPDNNPAKLMFARHNKSWRVVCKVDRSGGKRSDER